MHFIRKLSVAVVAAGALAVCGAAGAFTKPGFPRIAGIQIGSPFNYNDSTYQANLAKQNIMVLGMYPGLLPGNASLNGSIAAIKAKNPNALVFLYSESDYQNPLSVSGAWATFVTKMNAMKWWLYTDKGLSSAVKSVAGSGDFTVNNSLNTPRDSNGDNAIDWITKFYVNTYVKPNPAVDGLFMDNTFIKPNVDGDWNRDGVVDAADSAQAATWLRQGYARYYTLAPTLISGKYWIGNIGDWADKGAVPSEYNKIVNGGVMEAYIGKSYSVESWAGWSGMMTRYTSIMGAMLEPKLGIFNIWGDPTDYQTLRYALASCLMNDGYFSYTPTTTQYNGVAWFDEFDSNLGQASGTAPTAAWQKGVWRRDFDNGIALVNPKGNGTQTVTLEAAFVKLKGTQDPATNNGASVTTVTLKERDGIILLRTNPMKRPAAPKSLTTQN